MTTYLLRSANNISHFKTSINSLKSKIRLADFENQHCESNSSVLWSQQLILSFVNSWAVSRAAYAVYEIAWSFTVFPSVSLSPSPLLQLFPFSRACVYDCSTEMLWLWCLWIFTYLKKIGNIGGRCWYLTVYSVNRRLNVHTSMW